MKVNHSIFGEGTITEKDDVSVLVDFNGEVKRFLYPQAFDQHLMALDEEVHEQLSEQAEEVIQEEEEKRQADAERRRQERLADPVIAAKRQSVRREIAAAKIKGIAFRHELTGEDGETPEPVIEDWHFSAGYYQSGKREGQPIVMREAKRQALGIFTTVAPDQTEADREIFALFLVSKAFEGDDKDAGYVEGNSEYKLTMTPEEAKQLLYWNYYASKSRSPRTTWGSGQFRYIENEVTAQILVDAVKLKEGTEDEELAQRFLDHYCSIHDVNLEELPEPHGALVIQAEEEAAEADTETAETTEN